MTCHVRLLSFLVISVISVPASVFAKVVINEIAWMGTVPKAGETASVAANNEWIELYSDAAQSLDGWSLVAADGTPSIQLTGSVSPGGYFLLERTNDDTVPIVPADQVYVGSLGNSGEHLILKDAAGASVDEVNASSGWPAGDNASKNTMQRVGSSWITAVPTPRAANAAEASVPNTSSSDSASADGSTSSAGGGGSSTYTPPEKLPQIKAVAGSDRVVVVGEEIVLEGSAYGFEDEPLDDARYLWNFGDAIAKEGRRVSHAYTYPGTYIVRLNASSGRNAAHDDLTVTVKENTVSMSEIQPTPDGWVELWNKAAQSIAIGGWMLLHDHAGVREQFIFPQDTYIAPSAFLVVNRAISTFLFSGEAGAVTLAYPSGKIIDTLSYPAGHDSARSISKNNGVLGITAPTPGAQNTEAIPWRERAHTVAPAVSVSVQSAPLPKVIQGEASLRVPAPSQGVEEANLSNVISRREEEENPAGVESGWQEGLLFTRMLPGFFGSQTLAWFSLSLGIGVLGAMFLVALYRGSKR